jgi:hypothetical protein
MSLLSKVLETYATWQMRTNMDPLTPATSTLAPAISHIAETTSALSTGLVAHVPPPKEPGTTQKEKERQTVRWVLAAPARLRKLVSEGNRAGAEQDWEIVRRLLDRWKDISGSEDVRTACEQALEDETDD